MGHKISENIPNSLRDEGNTVQSGDIKKRNSS